MSARVANQPLFLRLRYAALLAVCTALCLVSPAPAQMPSAQIPSTQMAPTQYPSQAPASITSTGPMSSQVPGASTDASGYPTTPDTLLAPGDSIAIRLFEDPEYTFAGRISVDGTVLLPLIGIVHLEGLSVTAAEERIAQRLKDAGMYRNPQVTLSLTEGPNASATLSGEMHSVIPVVGYRTLFAVISAGGGLPPTANRNVTILRPGHPEPINVYLGTDPEHATAGLTPIFPGDTIMVTHLGVLYVGGEFHAPGVVQMTNYAPLTLSQVSAMVGGPVWDAKYSALHIIRTVGDHRTVTTLNIKDVLYGKAPDPIMQPNDIIFLPPSAIKSSLSNGSLGSILGVFSFALATFYTLR